MPCPRQSLRPPRVLSLSLYFLSVCVCVCVSLRRASAVQPDSILAAAAHFGPRARALAEYKTVKAVNGPLVILEDVKVRTSDL